MSLNLSTVQYLVFDEADRLFELGFATHLLTVLEKLPVSRQTLLFSATLPKSLVDFAKAGLREPKLVRLDSEMKISSDLRMSFWTVRDGEKDAALLCLLRDVIGVPKKTTINQSEKSKKKKSTVTGSGAAVLAPHQTIVFVSTQHHVAYISSLLDLAGYSVSSIYGTLTQAARTSALSQFLDHQSSVLVTTDVAARGIDIPILENVVNYDFPVGNRVFVHRVGRTARMGRKGWAWSFIGRDDVPYLLDLQLFLGRPLVDRVGSTSEATFVDSLILGPFPRDLLDQEIEYVRSLDDVNFDLVTTRGVMERGTKMYNRTKGKASPISYTRAKEFLKNKKWGFINTDTVNPAWDFRVSKQLGTAQQSMAKGTEIATHSTIPPTQTREALLASLATFKPSETVFEIGSRGKTTGALLMKERRRTMSKVSARLNTVPSSDAPDSRLDGERHEPSDIEMADEVDIQSTFGKPGLLAKRDQNGSTEKQSFKDEEFYMSHYQKDAETEKGYSLRDGASFAEQASQVTFDLTMDAGAMQATRRQSQLKWDRKKKKFVKGDGAGADNVKLIKTESGTKLPVTYKSGRYEEWTKGKGKGREIRIGETEKATTSRQSMSGKRWKHSKVMEPKALDKLATDYERKMRILKKKSADGGIDPPEGRPKNAGKGVVGRNNKSAGARWKGKSIGKVKNELRTVDQIRKQRDLLQKKREKNARGPRKSKGRR
ncbi:ATP-dependent RNA helicase dbp10 [Serendipita sp. 411]|nr:ATP-dependent RNA helicase dbp10 [Serendipita sp. 411]